MSLALSIFVFFISFLPSVNGAQLSNTTSLSLLSRFAVGGGTGGIVLVALTSTYVSL